MAEENRTWEQQNKSLGTKKAAVYALASAAGFLLLFFGGVFFAAGRREQAVRTFQIVAFGDSVLGETRDETSVTALLSGLLNRTVFNAALGGTCLSRADQECRPGLGQDMLSMTALAKALAAHDFGPQQTVRIRESSTDYFDETIDTLAQIDFSAGEILLIQYGLNDYNRGVAIYDEEDPWNEYTFAGALRSTLKLLQETFPDQRIILATPCYSWYIAGGKACGEYDLGGGTLDEYVEAELEIAAQMGVEIFDLYHDLWPHEKWEDWELYTKDGFHPNEAGRELIARRIAEYLESEPAEPES